MDLAELLRAAIADNSTLINHTVAKWPDRPIQLEMNWHPKMGKCDLVVKTIDHLPSYRPSEA